MVSAHFYVKYRGQEETKEKMIKKVADMQTDLIVLAADVSKNHKVLHQAGIHFNNQINKPERPLPPQPNSRPLPPKPNVGQNSSSKEEYNYITLNIPYR